MVEIRPVPGPAPYIYVATRLRSRKARLIPPAEYPRLLNMSLESLIRFIHESGYKREIEELSLSMKGMTLIETALTKNFARSFHSVLHLAPGNLKTLTSRYLHRWDIINVMSILRGKQHNIPVQKINEILIPAGELEEEFLRSLIQEESVGHIIDKLGRWRLSPILKKEFDKGVVKGTFSRVENELYKQYYADMIRDAGSGITGGDIFLKYLRLEIDIVNIKNLFRLRSGGVTDGIAGFIIPGGNNTAEEYVHIAKTENREEFISLIKQTSQLHVFTSALKKLFPETISSEEEAAERTWERWQLKKTPAHQVEIAVETILLDQMEGISKRHAFSILPILVYFERKRYEIANLRAIARGKQYGMPDDFIRRYLVL